MLIDLFLLYAYRVMAGLIAIAMVWVIFRDRDWRQQVSAALIFIPLVLRAVGVK
jgi:ABC-type molybdate transport system permease subunit